MSSQESSVLLQELKPIWNKNIQLSMKEKFGLLEIPYQADQLFPFLNAVSDDINKEAFSFSHLKQPDLFIRIRPIHSVMVQEKISKAGIPYSMMNEDCICLLNGTKIDTILEIDKEVVIQDYSSQQVSELMKMIAGNTSLPISIWDCCAASGGKSILAKDVFGNIDLTVSDIRDSILSNLRTRFKIAGITGYKSFVADISKLPPKALPHSFDLVIVDAPCSGSGTWGRTPEAMHFFKKESIDTYSQLQKRMVTNIIPQIKKNGWLLYITCSVFRKENEDVVDFIKLQPGIELISQRVFKGYTNKADTMFAALFKLNEEKPAL